MNIKMLYNKLINLLVCNGKKTKSSSVVKKTFLFLIKTYKKNPNFLVKRAVFNLTPVFEIKRIKKGSQTLNIPKLSKQDRRQSLALRWLTHNSKTLKKQTAILFSSEIYNSAFSKGKAFEKKMDIIKKVEFTKN